MLTAEHISNLADNHSQDIPRNRLSASIKGSTARKATDRTVSSFYWRAASMLDALDAREGSLRSLATKYERFGDAKRLLALLIETLKCESLPGSLNPNLLIFMLS